ncbi:MAG: HAD family hydrolase [Pseudomonadota bacterium]
MRIAVWSGPRNLSTAMMYSFGNRADMNAVDEPFYGAFLKHSGIDHPMAAESMASMECDPARVVAGLRDFDTPHQYEKHMPHHMLPGFPMDWLEEARHVVLLRHPARVLASYLRKREAPTADDLGFTTLARVVALLPAPVIIDSADIRAHPRAALGALCDALSLPFHDAMLDWPAGPKTFDGAWAPHWYDAVHRSTGFGAAEGPVPDVPDAYAKVVGEATALYDAMKARALRP